MLASLLFAVYATVGLVAGVLVIAARSPRTAVSALWVGLLAGCCAYAQVMAPAVAAVQLVMLAGAAIAALRVAVRATPARVVPPGPRGWRRLAVVVPVAAFALVLVSTWARQYVWTGRELPPDTRLGAVATIGRAWAELYAPTLGLAMMALLIAAIAGLAGREHRL